MHGAGMEVARAAGEGPQPQRRRCACIQTCGKQGISSRAGAPLGAAACGYRAPDQVPVGRVSLVLFEDRERRARLRTRWPSSPVDPSTATSGACTQGDESEAHLAERRQFNREQYGAALHPRRPPDSCRQAASNRKAAALATNPRS